MGKNISSQEQVNIQKQAIEKIEKDRSFRLSDAYGKVSVLCSTIEYHLNMSGVEIDPGELIGMKAILIEIGEVIEENLEQYCPVCEMQKQLKQMNKV